MTLKIGNISIKNEVALAPMAGLTTPAYIKICEEMGLGFAITELISSEAIVRQNQKTFEMLNGIEKLKIPFAVQIFGANPDIMAESAKILVDHFHIAWIDINMGCPVPKVAIKAHAGSALLKDPDKVFEIVSKVCSKVSVPVTVKIRSGWDEAHINAVTIAKKCEEAGASAITIHPRTRTQGYSGKSDWNIIKEVKENISIPVIGNGDIKTAEDVKRMLNETGCDAVMIGRGALGNPWLIKDCIEYIHNQRHIKEITNEEKIDMMEKHYQLLKADKNEKLALLEMRTNILYYLKNMPNNKEIKMKVCTAKEERELLKILEEYRMELKQNLQESENEKHKSTN